MGGRNIPEQEFKKRFLKIYGRKRLDEFVRHFRENFIQESDFRKIKGLGFNCVRIPFNFRLLFDGGLEYLDQAVSLCRRYKIYCILDLHAAAGSQNEDWHSDSLGQARLWKSRNFKRQFVKAWEFLAERFKDEPVICGYDILNEPVHKDSADILDLYKDVISQIRRIDKNHIIFLEGNNWAQEIEFLGRPWADNLVYSIHFYAPLEFTFNFVHNLKYPGKIFARNWSKDTLKRILRKYYQLKNKWDLPIYVGEFGQNSRCFYCHQFNWTRDVLDIFSDFGFHWTYWTWKAVANSVFPDGVYQYQQNPSWINRQGPVLGWEAYYALWQRYKKGIISSWRTEQFLPNQTLISILTK